MPHSQPSSGRWFYRVHGLEHGPVAWEELKALAQSGAIKPSDLLRREGDDRWVVATRARQPQTVAISPRTSQSQAVARKIAAALTEEAHAIAAACPTAAAAVEPEPSPSPSHPTPSLTTSTMAAPIAPDKPVTRSIMVVAPEAEAASSAPVQWTNSAVSSVVEPIPTTRQSIDAPAPASSVEPAQPQVATSDMRHELRSVESTPAGVESLRSGSADVGSIEPSLTPSAPLGRTLTASAEQLVRPAPRASARARRHKSKSNGISKPSPSAAGSALFALALAGIGLYRLALPLGMLSLFLAIRSTPELRRRRHASGLLVASAAVLLGCVDVGVSLYVISGRLF